MKPEHVIHVKNTWALILPVADKAAKLLYDKVFELEPPLQPLFSGDMTVQGRKLMNMIDTVVNSLDRHKAMVPSLQQLGERHAGYGVKDNDYDILGAALLWTLETCLGENFTPEVKEAWTITYNELARAMKTAATVAA
ncbi:MAG: globin family protein [Gammaproteobacteria bacterium]|jgi:hemoglobin-like flavoprotein